MASLPAVGPVVTDRKVMFEVPDGKTAVIENISVVNEGSDTVTMNLYVNVNGVLTRIAQKDQILPGGAIGLDVSLRRLSSGNKIEADASVNGALVIAIFGQVT